MRSIFVLGTLGALLTGCAPIGGQELATTKDACKTERQAAEQGPIVGRLVWEGDDPTPAQLASADLPSPQERDLLARYADAAARCLDREADWIGAYQAWQYPYATQAVTAKKIALADLVAGKASYGLTNQRLATIDTKLMAEYANAGMQNQMARQAAFQSAMYNLGQAGQEFGPPPPQYPAYYPPPAPPAPVNCRTVFIGNIARTQCF